MSMLEMTNEPSPRDLKIFALLLPAFFGLLGVLALFKAETLVAISMVLSVAVIISLIFNSDMARPKQWLGFLMPATFALIGLSATQGSAPWTVAVVVWIVGIVVGPFIWIVPSFAHKLYVGWLLAAEPIGWTITQLLMAIVYYLVLTPIALVMRLIGHDPMQRRFDPSAKTYWVEHNPHHKPDRYFHQF